VTETIDSQSWTGRAPWAGNPLQVARRRLCNLLYPSYECQQCVGQEAHWGCYCGYHLCVSPCVGPGAIHHWLRGFAERHLGVTP